MNLVFLWTDILIWTLSVAIGVFCIYNLKKPHLRKIWKTIFNNKIALNSLLILSIYIMVTMLDSIHFYNEKQSIVSVLDTLLVPMNSLNEKTYSAPFATHSFVKETIAPNQRGYPVLKKAGTHLEKYSQKYTDILTKTALSIGVGILFWWILLKTNKNKPKSILQKTKYILLILLILFSFVIYLSQYYHIFGTDKVGQDILYQSIKSIRTGIVIGTLTTLIMLPFAIIFGLVSGFLGGWIDDIIQYIYTTINSIPGVLLIAASILMVQTYISNHPDALTSVTEQADLRLLSLCLILGITSWTSLCRILRSEVLKIRETEFILAAKTLGLSNIHIMSRHLLPNVMHIILISIVLDFSSLVLAEAVLSYIGIGVDPNSFSFGNMINLARFEMAREPVIWWSLVAAFNFMFILVLSANLFADIVRDAFDPRTTKQH